MAEQTDAELCTVDSATLRLANRLFRTMRQTFINRGLYQQRQDGTIREVEWIGWTPWPDQRAFAFVLDTGTLPVSIERLCDEKVIHQVSTALGGRRVEVVNHRGVAWLLAMDLPPLEDPQPRRRLPRRVSLDLDAVPDTLKGTGGRFMVSLGVGHNGPVWRSLLDLDCILVGGVRGYGKTTFLFSALVALLQQHGPHELQVAIVDPKGFDFSLFDGVPHLWAERATDAEVAARLLANLVAEMDDRGERFARLGVRNLEAFNEASAEPLPLLLVVVDEVTDLMLEAGRQAAALQRCLVRLVSKGRAAGGGLLVATQNPKSEVFSTLARGNFKTRIAFWVSEAVMSRTILNRSGAEQLPQVQGRMLALVEGQSSEPLELQGFYLDDESVKTIVGELAGREYSRLTTDELLVFAWAAEHDGYLGIEDIARLLSTTAWQARKLAATWERRGWLEKDRSVGNKRKVTEALCVLLPECEGL
jgi:DNA segregation ATPase FtsK/SpoIIIE-like protein